MQNKGGGGTNPLSRCVKQILKAVSWHFKLRAANIEKNNSFVEILTKCHKRGRGARTVTSSPLNA